MVDAEQALFLQHLPAAPPANHSRLYYGAEFCFWRFPPVSKILAARQWTVDAGWDFTLVTPLLAEDERCRLQEALQELLPQLTPGDEVLISDWGALELVRAVRQDLVVILGRTLSGQKRGPRSLGLSLTAAQQEYFQRGSWHNREAVTLLAEQGINRIEQDNLLQGLAPLPEGLHGSLHRPYAMVTSSRNCPFRPTAIPGPCPAPCGALFSLRSNETDVLLYQDGNTQFLRNVTLPDDLAGLRIDRIVTHVADVVDTDR